MIETFQARLMEVLTDQGYTLHSFAKDSGISYFTMHKWFKENTMPTCGRLVEICEKLLVSADFLLGLSDEP